MLFGKIGPKSRAPPEHKELQAPPSRGFHGQISFHLGCSEALLWLLGSYYVTIKPKKYMLLFLQGAGAMWLHTIGNNHMAVSIHGVGSYLGVLIIQILAFWVHIRCP